MPFFDNAPHFMFSGSYVDPIMSGALIQSKNRTIDGSYTLTTGSRVQVASNVIFSSTEVILTSTIDFGQYTNMASGSLKNRGITKHNVRVIQCDQKDTQYYDTFLPVIDDIWNVDVPSGSVMLAYAPDAVTTSSYGMLCFVYAIGTHYASVGFEGYTSLIDEVDFTTVLSNDAWPLSFPYQKKYRAIARTQNLDLSLANKKYNCSASLDGTGRMVVGHRSSRLYTDAAVTQMASNKSSLDPYIFNSNFSTPPGIATIGYSINQTYDPFPGVPTNGFIGIEALFSTGGVVVNQSFLPAVTGTYQQPGAANAKKPQAAHITDLTKHFFGFGRGPSNIVEFATAFTSSQTRGNNRLGIRYGSMMSGWKYGILNGFEQNPRILVNRNHYGHLRDLFEQRAYSRWVKKETNTFDNPIEIAFVSGSDAYTSASNLLNNTDSGMYNTFYCAGAPWTDV